MFLEPTIMPIITVKTKDGLPRVMTLIWSQLLEYHPGKEDSIS